MSCYNVRGMHHSPCNPRKLEYLHDYPIWGGKLNGSEAFGGQATRLCKENRAVQLLHRVLDAHEVLPDTQYDDDDIGYAVPELCRTDKPAASNKQLFCE